MYKYDAARCLFYFRSGGGAQKSFTDKRVDFKLPARTLHVADFEIIYYDVRVIYSYGRPRARVFTCSYTFGSMDRRTRARVRTLLYV